MTSLLKLGCVTLRIGLVKYNANTVARETRDASRLQKVNFDHLRKHYKVQSTDRNSDKEPDDTVPLLKLPIMAPRALPACKGTLGILQNGTCRALSKTKKSTSKRRGNGSVVNI